jgi:hypothetical protein
LGATTIAFVSWANRSPLDAAKLADAAWKPPVLNQTMTGARAGREGAQILSIRQSSFPDG